MMTTRYNHVHIIEMGQIEGVYQTDILGPDSAPCSFSACLPLLLIRMAWEAGLDLEEAADGFGPGEGTHGDWSAIRDSSPEATDNMLRMALNHLTEIIETIAVTCTIDSSEDDLSEDLPDLCYILVPGTESVGIITRGESGYHMTDWPENGYTEEIVANMNKRLGVTDAQAQAMLAGSMFGWGIPAADPAAYMDII